MQRKISNIKDKELNSSSSGRLGSMLHSIPILLSMKNKSNVLYSIPCVKSCACTFCRVVNKIKNDDTDSNSHSTNVVRWTSPHLKNQTRSSRIMTPYSRISSWSKLSVFTFLLLGISFLSVLGSIVVGSNSCYAADTTSASLSLSNPNMTSSAITPGNTTTVSTNVSVKVDNAESYSLVLSVDSSSITNGNTTLVAGNVVSDNTWGYKWDNATTYSTPSTSGTTLTNSTLVPLDSNGNISFTKNLTFGAKFSTSADSGHYKGSGTLSLVAEPKSITLGIWSNGINSGITTMQEMTPEVCNQVSTPIAVGTPGGTKAPTLKLKDSRDENEYTIAKLPDGKCWMVENLNLRLSTTKALTSTDSDIDSDDSSVSSWTPTQNTIVGESNLAGTDFSINFDYNNKPQSYTYSTDADTVYYNWYAATAGTGTSSVAKNGTNVNSSICPKGWTLPTGKATGANTSNDFYNLFSKMNLGVTVSTSGSTPWGSSQGLAISQASPYNFAYTGYVDGGSLGHATNGIWWSRTASSSGSAYYLYIDGSNMFPGITTNSRYNGLAVRCVASQSSADVSDW